MTFNLKTAICTLVICTLLAIIVKITVVQPRSNGTIDNDIEVTSKIVNLPDGASLYWIKDNKGQKLFPCDLFGSESESLCKVLELTEGIPAAVNTFLLKVDGKFILFDTGLGELGGEALNNLKKINVSPDSISFVYLTHLHVDHISGLVTHMNQENETKTFKNAALYISKPEYNASMNALANNELQKKILKMYKDNIHLFDYGDVLPHNVLAIDAAGHTPGHTAFQYKQVLVVGDLMHGYALQKDHLEINSKYDSDKTKSVESRKRLMAYAKKNNLTIAGMHLPHFGFAK